MSHLIRGGSDLPKLLGMPLAITTTHATFRGELFCYDVGQIQRIVLKEDLANDTANFHVILSSCVRNIVVEGPTSVSACPPLNAFNPRLLEEREKLYLESFEEQKRRIGIGVTEQEQKLFDILRKSLGIAEWVGNDISVLNGEVKITPPYRVECVSGDNLECKSRVIHVLESIEKENTMHKTEKRDSSAP